ncbi:RNA polymerase sigma factor [Sphingobacterium sp. N143]|uniref:RNA polymerase sigma factor n=1 Tax=Sphingobacterium sp. N143 TaxID=2746727 RepID=UPI0025766D42|nr:RNA polymerase sigma factor [Sphingobacterium sp. N143]MDM1293267.1 RNA polymerase sigma factor [Sphingobacterium sp. N143]
MENTTINQLFKEKRPTLKYLAAQFTNDPDEREDLVQETMVRSLSSIEKFLKHPKLMSWLYIIMKNTYINQYTRNKRLENYRHEYAHTNNMNDVTGNRGENNFVAADIQQALNNLSNDYYNAFAMFLEGFKYYEIAEQLQIPEGTVKTRIHMARKSLQKQLKTYSKSIY